MDLSKLSRVVSHALRHEPWLYELELDDNGWVSVDALLAGLRTQSHSWASLTENELALMVASSDKRRYELAGSQIRALYGHSTPQRLLREPALPPEILYHGASPGTAVIIETTGLKPMGRQYVHLSADRETAIQVGLRKSSKPVILEIRSAEAHSNGVHFYRGNELVWLADSVPQTFIGSCAARVTEG